jgi:beta-phosphoglucomutase-like phosphatase (HAD superfamily)
LTTFERLFRDSDTRLARHPNIGRLGFRDTVVEQAGLLSVAVPDGPRVAWDQVADEFCASSTAAARRNGFVLESLARRWQLGVVSNFTGNLLPCLEELGLARHFGVVVDSGVEGREKPDPHVFHTALTRLGASPLGSWMIGDNVEADIRPALALGLRACWLTEPSRTAPRGLVPTARIARFSELESALAIICTA